MKSSPPSAAAAAAADLFVFSERTIEEVSFGSDGTISPHAHALDTGGSTKAKALYDAVLIIDW